MRSRAGSVVTRPGPRTVRRRVIGSPGVSGRTTRRGSALWVTVTRTSGRDGMGAHDVQQHGAGDDADRDAEEEEEELARGHGARWTGLEGRSDHRFPSVAARSSRVNSCGGHRPMLDSTGAPRSSA